MTYSLLGIGLAVLVLYPEIDIAVSQYFYSSTMGFYMKNTLFATLLYGSVDILLLPLLAGLVSIYLYQYFTSRIFVYLNRKAIVYIISVFVIGSGIIVNAGLKEHVGRARPKSVEIFGGTKKFTPACILSSECQHNCSFSCGHCSFAFGFLSFAVLFPRMWIMILSIGYGVLVSLARIMQGGHFLSDAIFSAVIMFAVARIVYWWMYRLKSIR